ncbi:MAG: flagellar hook-basal body complex protein FliE [Bdellovibrionales bacterium]
MVSNIADVMTAYRQPGGGGIAKALGNTAGAGNESFADALKGFANDAVSALKEGEKAATAGATGKADLTSVVVAINNAELMLQTVVAIRDKVVSAYQSIVQTAV